jgi:hypothetical protein
VAADLDVTLMADIDAPNVQVRQLDLSTDELPRDAFDLVHTPDRPAAHRRSRRGDGEPRRGRAPRRVPMLEEDDIFPVRATATGD